MVVLGRDLASPSIEILAPSITTKIGLRIGPFLISAGCIADLGAIEAVKRVGRPAP